MNRNVARGQHAIIPPTVRSVFGVMLQVMFVFLLVLAGCTTRQATPQPAVTLPATDTPAPVAVEEGGATAVATTAPVGSATLAPQPTTKPSATAKPTSKPLPPQPPRLVQRTPARGEELAPKEAIVLRFDQAMDEGSVNKAFSIKPETPGKLSWDDAQTVRFVPQDAGFTRDATYRVSVATSARSANDLPLTQPVELLFQTVGYLQVANVLPTDDSTEVASDTVIRVFFNRPVAPLTAIQAQGDLPQPLEISPAVEGEGTWTNTSIYTFTPSKGLAPGTAYRVTIVAGLNDTTGGTLKDDYVWSFTTDVPRVAKVFPERNSQYISPKTGIKITFNQPMEAGATEKLFSLTPKGKAPAAGQFTWAGSTLVFTPTQPLERGVVYEGHMREGAPAITGEAALGEDYAWQFMVAPLPAVLKFSHASETRVQLGTDMRITFSSPISTPTFSEGVVISPSTQFHAWWDVEDTVAYFYGSFKPSTDYTLTLTPKVTDRWGEPLRKATTYRFRTAPYEPVAYLNVPAQVSSYNAYSKPTISASYRNVSRLNMALYGISVDEFISLTREDSYDIWRKFRGREDNLVKRWSQAVRAPLDATRTYTNALTTSDGGPLKAGLYYLELSAQETQDISRHVLVVSDTNLTLKASRDEVLVWATDLKDGEPVEDVQIIVYDAQGHAVTEGSTDEDGILMTGIPPQDFWASMTILGRRGDGIAVVLRNWQQGIGPYEFGLSYEPTTPNQRAYFYTDRRIYRPGQTVYFKGILRNDNDARYTLPPEGAQMNLSLIDGQGRELWQDVQAVNEMGTLAGEIALSQDASLGYYFLQATYEDQSYGASFQVAEYRKPDFQVAVSLDKKDYLAGDTIEATVETSYFFGGPVANAVVRWRVSRQPYYFDRWQGEGYYSFTDYDESEPQSYYGELVTEGEGKTDGQGRLVVKAPADLRERKQSQTYTFEMSVTDVNNQEVSGRSSAVVHKGNFYIGLAPVVYLGTAKQPQTIRGITVDTQGITRTQQTLEVVLYRHEYFSVRKQTEDGDYYWSNEIRDTAVATQTVKTDDRGFVEFQVTPPEGGEFKVLARGHDEFENEVSSAVYIWVSDRAFINWGQQNHDRIELVADKKEYAPGDTAKILIPSPYQGRVTALLTIERGRVLEYQLLTLESNSEQLSLPIAPAYAPNVFVSVVLVKGMDANNPISGFKVGYVMLPVSAVQQELTVKVTAQGSNPYKPRDEVTYQVETLDYRGQGVEAEVSLQLVDLAVESMLGPDTRSIMQEFYRQRGVGVSTSATMVVSVDRRILEQAKTGKGGGGGEAAAGAVRELFPDTAFWDPVVRTDATGKAQVKVTLPDNLTTWRMTAQAVTAQTEVGQGTADIVASMQVMVRPVAPRFLVIGDRPTLGAVVHNNTDGDLEMKVSLAAEGVTIEGGEKTVKVPAHGRETVNWSATALATEEAVLNYSVQAGSLSDALIWRLPVHHPSTPERVATAGEVEEQAVELVRLPEEIDGSQGELMVTLEPSLAAAMQKGLTYLKSYPYDCVEQTVSRFLPNVVTFRALQKLGLQNQKMEVQLAQMVGVGVQRLYSLQNPDGGWGWWANERSSPTITAYVLLGLAEAQRNDFLVDRAVVDRASGYLYQWLDEKRPDTYEDRNERAMVLYALSEAGLGDLGRVVALYDKRAAMAQYARAYLAMALFTLNPDETTRLTTLANELNNAAIVSATGAHWEETRRSALAMNTTPRTTAIVLRALMRIQPENKLLPNAVRWLMSVREDGAWTTTQENTWSILALTDYMLLTGELLADYSYELAIGGVVEAQGSVSKQTVDQAIEAKVPVSELAVGEDSPIVITRQAAAGQKNTGKLYYSATLRYFLPADQIEPLDRGIFVSREYSLEKDRSQAINGAQVNDTVVVTLTLVAPNDLYYLILEDPLPAGCEAIDTSLQTTSQATQEPDLKGGTGGDGYGWPWVWATHTELRDEKVVLFASYLPRGTYQYSYSVRATTPGEFRVAPAVAYEMYFADVFGRSGGTVFTVE